MRRLGGEVVEGVAATEDVGLVVGRDEVQLPLGGLLDDVAHRSVLADVGLGERQDLPAPELADGEYGQLAALPADLDDQRGSGRSLLLGAFGHAGTRRCQGAFAVVAPLYRLWMVVRMEPVASSPKVISAASVWLMPESNANS